MAQTDKHEDRKSAIEQENKRTEKDRPLRGPDPDTLEGPGDRQEAKGEEDARNKVTRRGER